MKRRGSLNQFLEKLIRRLIVRFRRSQPAKEEPRAPVVRDNRQARVRRKASWIPRHERHNDGWVGVRPGADLSEILGPIYRAPETQQALELQRRPSRRPRDSERIDT